MNFDSRGYAPDPVAQAHIRAGAAVAGLKEAAFYSGGLLHASGRALTFVHVPVVDILKDLAAQPVLLTRRSIAEAAVLRSEYQRMLRASGLRTYLRRQFFKKVQEECCWHQQYARRPLHEPGHDRVRQEFLSYELHHRIPISLGGGNQLDNLVFLPHNLHTKIHVAINRATNHLREGMSETIAIPYPRGIFPVRPRGRAARSTPHEAATV